MFDVATAAATFPTGETVILAEAPPRIDEMSEHAKSGNKELSRLWREAGEDHHRQARLPDQRLPLQ